MVETRAVIMHRIFSSISSSRILCQYQIPNLALCSMTPSLVFTGANWSIPAKCLSTYQIKPAQTLSKHKNRNEYYPKYQKTKANLNKNSSKDTRSDTEPNEQRIRPRTRISSKLSDDYFEHLLLNEMEHAIKSGTELTTSDWAAIDNKLKSAPEIHQPWPAKFMRGFSCRLPESMSAARALMQYCKVTYQTKELFNRVMLATQGWYLVFLARGHAAGLVDELEVLALYEEIRAQTDALSHGMASLLIQGLYQTKRWRECLVILRDIQNPTLFDYSHVVAAAVIHGEMGYAWQMLEKMGDNGLIPTNQLFLAILKEAHTIREHGVKLLQMMEHYLWIPSKPVAAAIVDWIQSDPDKKWTSSNVVIPHRGICPGCGHHLKPATGLTSEQFTQMRKAFMKHALIRGNVLINSSDEELWFFKIFLSNSQQYNIVLDALNICSGGDMVDKRRRSERLYSTVSYLHDELKYNVLLIGPRFMQKRYPHMPDIQAKAQCFFTDISSQDDPFIIYAALHSGPDTLVVTEDEFRDHGARMGPDNQLLFRRWLRQHQVVPTFTDDPVTRFKWPKNHETCVQCTEHGWHVPYKDADSMLVQRSQVPDTWMCVQPAPSS